MFTMVSRRIKRSGKVSGFCTTVRSNSAAWLGANRTNPDRLRPDQIADGDTSRRSTRIGRIASIPLVRRKKSTKPAVFRRIRARRRKVGLARFKSMRQWRSFGFGESRQRRKRDRPRKTHLHQLTAAIACRFGGIAVEDLRANTLRPPRARSGEERPAEGRPQQGDPRRFAGR